MRGSESAVFLGPVMADRMDPHDRSRTRDLHRLRHDRHLDLLSPPYPSGPIQAGEQLSAVRIVNDPVALQLQLQLEDAGTDPEVVLEATYGWVRSEGA